MSPQQRLSTRNTAVDASASIAVAICTRNRPVDLSRCLSSVLASPLVKQVVVSIDGLDSATDEVLADAAARDSRVTWIRGPRQGLAANRNACIRSVTEEYVLFLDDDALLSPDFMPVVVQHLDSQSILTGGEIWNGDIVTPRNADFLGFQRLAPTSSLRAIVINSTIFPIGFLKETPFDESYQYGSEEVDIALAAIHLGLRIVFIEAYNLHNSSPVARHNYEQLALRSRSHFSVARYRVYEPSLARLLLFLTWGSINAIGAAYRSRGGPGAIRALVDFFRGACLPTRRSILPPLTPVAGPLLSTSVLVPTFRRPEQLHQCLHGIRSQICPPDQVIVIRRSDDDESAEVVASWPGVEEMVVSDPGQVAAIRAGITVARGDVIALLDDDAIPRADWLATLLAHYADPDVIAVGGRDVVHSINGIEPGHAQKVGLVTRFGRIIGNHHIGDGPPRRVHILKGCNSSYRRGAIRTPVGLRGVGAEVHNDMASSLAVSSTGASVIFDPGALVDHYPGVRIAGQDRSILETEHLMEAAYNATYVLASLRPDMRWRRVVYSTLVGDRGAPGLLRAVVARLRRERDLYGACSPSVRAVVRATIDAQIKPLVMT